ncbi:ras association domain-containing protein 4a isoform X2 [Cyprinus carpio]|uniref:Ras association domain family member 4 n=2 Tax=Cyprinus carpio TaxID=7962 RepID=A0A8C1HV12_CYPCA|nr:ras association domain-containing protein 4a isoform X2 [Cyprinus carpio]
MSNCDRLQEPSKKPWQCYTCVNLCDNRPTKEEGELIVEGLLNISWGLRRPIRLEMHDDNERFRYACTSAWRSESSEFSRNENAEHQFCSEPNNNKISASPVPSADGAEEDIPQLLRTRSDASFVNIQRRSKTHNTADIQRIKRHRFSINGHFYNHKTSVFTPSYGSVTNVRVNSTLTTQQVLNLLLNKFRVENKADEFGLYLVHESGERAKLKDTEYPLVSRLLHGPCEKIARIFIMEKDLGEEITYDVAQYIKFEMPVLGSFIKKLKEEEEREILKLTRKYSALRSMILQKLDAISNTANYA